MNPYKIQNLGIVNGLIFLKISNLSQYWLKFKKMLQKSGDSAQNVSKKWANWVIYLFIHFKLVYVLVYIQIPRQHYLPKPNLSIPPGCLSFTSCKISLTHPILRNTIILTILTMYLIDWLNKCHMMYHLSSYILYSTSYQAILISGHFYQ